MKNCSSVCPLVKWVSEEIVNLHRIKPSLDRAIELLGEKTVYDFLESEDVDVVQFVEILHNALLTCSKINFDKLVELGFKSELNIEETERIADPQWVYADEIVDNVYENNYIDVDDADEHRREVARSEEKEPPIGGSYPPSDLEKEWNDRLRREGFELKPLLGLSY